MESNPLPKVNDDFLTVQQAAARLRVGETAIRNAILRGRLPSLEMFGRKLIAKADLEAYQQNAKPGRPRKEANTA